MSTWHQRNAWKRNPAPFWHATEWTVVVDPPEVTLSLMRFSTEREAQEYSSKVPHSYVLAPANRGV